MRTYKEFLETNMSANIAGATATQILQQLDPLSKGKWDKIVTNFPQLYSFLTDLNKASNGSWKTTPAQFTQILSKHMNGVAGSLGNAQTAPFAAAPPPAAT
jgi:hypothetical protein